MKVKKDFYGKLMELERSLDLIKSRHTLNKIDTKTAMIKYKILLLKMEELISNEGRPEDMDSFLFRKEFGWWPE
jgi:hypothetical protein